MILKGIIDEDFVNYKKPSMVLEFPHCTFKCGADVCQNSPLIKIPDVRIDSYDVCRRYLDNPISEAVVFQGLEPLDSWEDVKDFVEVLRLDCNCTDDIVIYTGYDESEIIEKVQWLLIFTNIIVKFGRYIPGHEPHYDEVLGVYLASDNQYARDISNN